MGHGCHACGCPNGCECEEMEDRRKSDEILKKLQVFLGQDALLIEDVVKLKRKANTHSSNIAHLSTRLEVEKKGLDDTLKEWSLVGEKLHTLQVAHNDTYAETLRLIKEFKKLNP